MDTHLREHFDRAVGDDPGADAGAMAHAAIAAGGRMRRRRRTAAAGMALGAVTLLGIPAGVHLAADDPGTDRTTIAAAMMPVAAPSCSVRPVENDATDVVVFLREGLTDRQRSALGSALAGDARVATVFFESRAQAYERFRDRWRDSPDLVQAVGPQQLPESYRLRLVDPARYTAFRAEFAAAGGVQSVMGRVCPASAPVGGVL